MINWASLEMRPHKITGSNTLDLPIIFRIWLFHQCENDNDDNTKIDNKRIQGSVIGLAHFLFLLLRNIFINPKNCGRTRSLPVHQRDEKKLSHSTVAITVGYQCSLGSLGLQQKTHTSERTSERVSPTERRLSPWEHLRSDLTYTHGH